MFGQKNNGFLVPHQQNSAFPNLDHTYTKYPAASKPWQALKAIPAIHALHYERIVVAGRPAALYCIGVPQGPKRRARAHARNHRPKAGKCRFMQQTLQNDAIRDARTRLASHRGVAHANGAACKRALRRCGRCLASTSASARAESGSAPLPHRTIDAQRHVVEKVASSRPSRRRWHHRAGDEC